ncbi:MAG: hypothetical protein ABJQ14_24335 [Hyphomicrobiales bacterium]
MGNFKTHTFFDRAFVLSDPEDVAEFQKSPEEYLQRIGFFHGLDRFNGFIDLEGQEIQNIGENLSSFRGGQIVILGHLGIPYQDYCKCVCEVR